LPGLFLTPRASPKDSRGVFLSVAAQCVTRQAPSSACLCARHRGLRCHFLTFRASARERGLGEAHVAAPSSSVLLQSPRGFFLLFRPHMRSQVDDRAVRGEIAARGCTGGSSLQGYRCFAVFASRCVVSTRSDLSRNLAVGLEHPRLGRSGLFVFRLRRALGGREVALDRFAVAWRPRPVVLPLGLCCGSCRPGRRLPRSRIGKGEPIPRSSQARAH
jgi:hypothetical protein